MVEQNIKHFQSWRTLLMIPYGRGGAGFSVLDITKPTVTAGAEDDDGNYEPVQDLCICFLYIMTLIIKKL